MSSTKIIISISSSLILIITAIIILWVSGVFKSEETKLAEKCALNCDPISPIFSKEHCQQNCGSNCINCSYKWGTHLPYTSIPISQNNVVYTTTTVVPETTTTVVPTTTTTVVPTTTTTVVPTTTTNSTDSLINSLLSPLPIVNTVDAPKDCTSIEPGWSASSVISGGSVTKVCPYGTATATCDNGVLTKGSCPAPKDCTSIEPGWSASSVISGGSVTKTCPYGTATATCDNGVLTKGACPARSPSGIKESCNTLCPTSAGTKSIGGYDAAQCAATCNSTSCWDCAYKGPYTDPVVSTSTTASSGHKENCNILCPTSAGTKSIGGYDAAQCTDYCSHTSCWDCAYKGPYADPVVSTPTTAPSGFKDACNTLCPTSAGTKSIGGYDAAQCTATCNSTSCWDCAYKGPYY
jgi:hypothetical protein